MPDTTNPPSSPHLLVRAARGEAVERPPVWAMRQAGRWDPEFGKLRAGLSFYEFSENVELAARCSLLPKRFGVDAIILFYDITTLTVSMGLPFSLQPNKGPVPARPVHTMHEVELLDVQPSLDSFAHITGLLKRVKEELRGELPVIVFAGAPFTVATYCIGTGKDLAATRAFIHERPIVWEALLEKLQHATIHFLRVLIEQGADVYQLFDSWAGALTRDEYERWAQPSHRAILETATGAPRILFVKEGPYLDLMTQSGADVVSLGRVHDLAAARRDYPDMVFQGNVDEQVMKAGTPDDVIAATKRCLAEGGGRRHIVNFNHGCDKSMPVANFEAYVRAAKGLA
jgi:uroporphyrinogen decarboxylase